MDDQAEKSEDTKDDIEARSSLLNLSSVTTLGEEYLLLELEFIVKHPVYVFVMFYFDSQKDRGSHKVHSKM